LIEFIDVSKRFGRIAALDSVTLRIKKGEIFGLAGPNGAGKTTLVRILCTALKPDTGVVRLDGKDIRENPVEVRGSIGYLPEEPNLYERLTPKKFLSFFAELYGLDRINERVDEVLESMKLIQRKEDKISTFSKGMRHRLSLGRAILHDPKILVLDEPTMGLDPAVAADIRDMVARMKGEKTVILCTHYMDEAESLCGRMAILNRGKISVIDSPEKIKSTASEQSGGKSTLEEAFVYYTR